jgi:cell division protein FtsB
MAAHTLPQEVSMSDSNSAGKFVGQIVFLLVVLAVGGFVYHKFFYDPYGRENDRQDKDISTLREDNGKLRDTDVRHDTQIQALKDTDVKHDTQIAVLKDTDSKHETALADMKKSVDASAARVDKQDAALADMKKAHDSLAAELEQTRKDLSGSQADSNKRVRDLEDTVKKLVAEMERMKLYIGSPRS